MRNLYPHQCEPLRPASVQGPASCSQAATFQGPAALAAAIDAASISSPLRVPACALEPALLQRSEEAPQYLTSSAGGQAAPGACLFGLLGGLCCGSLRLLARLLLLCSPVGVGHALERQLHLCAAVYGVQRILPQPASAQCSVKRAGKQTLHMRTLFVNIQLSRLNITAPFVCTTRIAANNECAILNRLFKPLMAARGLTFRYCT